MRRSLSSCLVVLATVSALGCSGTSAAPPSGSAPAAGARVAVTVDAHGFHPGSVSIPVNQPATIVFTRTSDEGCGTQVAFPSLGVQRDLPLNEPVEVVLPPQSAGTITFSCGMGMLRGSVVAQ